MFPLDTTPLDLLVVILARDREHTIASTVYKVREGIGELANFEILVLDNGSFDQTSLISSMAGARVIRYRTRHQRSLIIGKAIDIALKVNPLMTILLDLLGGNTAEDAVSLARVSLEKGDRFAFGYVVPETGDDTIGCLALDRKSLNELSEKGEDIQNILLEIAHSRALKTTTFTETMNVVSKRKKRKRSRERSNFERLKNFRRNNPMKFFGSLGIITLLGAVTTGFYTVDYFYNHHHLFYPTSFLTVILVMISGFLMVAGLMMNALNVMVERIRSVKKWEKATVPVCREVEE